MISPYNKPRNQYLNEAMSGDFIVEEKIDGSQFSFSVEPFEGKLECRSNGAMIDLDNIPSMFVPAVTTAKRLAPLLKPMMIYRGETLQKPKHNTLAYDRVPKDNIILFDIEVAPDVFMRRKDKEDEAARLGLEVVPLLPVKSDGCSILDQISILGGQKIEGFVVKNYDKFTKDGKPLFVKVVSQEFKEIHGRDWKERNPNHLDVIEALVSELKTPARWNKAIIHLKEAGVITNTPKDIGSIIKEIQRDVSVEAEAHIKDVLMNHFWKQIASGVIKGVPEWYKEILSKEPLNNASV